MDGNKRSETTRHPQAVPEAEQIMNNVKKVAREGFKLSGDTDAQLAFLSLRIALEAYFSTYKASKHSINPIDPQLDARMEDNIHYHQAYAEAIVHFQHFFELIIKQILRKDHVLLASRISADPKLLHKILHGNDLTSEEQGKLQSVEFSEALKTICSLIRNDQLGNSSDLEFLIDNKPVLEELNILRNKVWHRGAFLLFYTRFDEFIGKYILPIIKLTLNLPDYRTVRTWKHKTIASGIDPITSIIEEFQTSNLPSLGKLALLKEMGRAAYNNPLVEKSYIFNKMNERLVQLENEIVDLVSRGEEPPKRLLISKASARLSYNVATHIDTPYIEKARKIAEHEAEKDLSIVKVCPVCGVESLVLYEESDYYEDTETGRDVYFRWVDKVKCECCTFQIHHHLEIGKYDLPIEDYWSLL